MGFVDWLMRDRDRKIKRKFKTMREGIEEVKKSQRAEILRLRETILKLTSDVGELKGSMSVLLTQKPRRIASPSQRGKALCQRETEKLRLKIVNVIREQLELGIPLPEVREEAMKLVSRSSFYRYLRQAQSPRI